ncbi:hypothetical protein BRADI_3g04681v3 [Brachypodium distachyon]|uniref:Leucine-rich repeat-containing N-terminal plant-type domain-containing protein n=2 Tax=Brachypodium distachyon TaxID=15368 RepID=A0A2K2CV96_BRADI|nr:hypothetical protein BRADI_3g04681v3 [Brachypodium distachyon]
MQSLNEMQTIWSGGLPTMQFLALYYILATRLLGQTNLQLIHQRPTAMTLQYNLLYFSALSVLLCMTSAVGPEGEALLRWKSTLLNSSSLSSWSRARPTCSWDGVKCDAAGHFTELRLCNSGLNGTLDAFYSAVFQHVTLLELWNNNLFGAIPSNISLLLTLTSLDLSNNNLVGAIPYQLSKLPRIVGLYLGNNQLTNLDTTMFSLMPCLQFLYLNGNQLNGTFPRFIQNRIFDLDLSHNAFSGSIPENLHHMVPNLVFLDLSSNMFSGFIPQSFSRLANLKELSLAENNFTGGIPKELSNLTNLRVMDLAWNMFSGGIPKELGNVINLVFMDLSWNMFSGGIPKELGNIISHVSMDLSRNMFSGRIPAELGNISNSLLMDLSWNMLSGALPPSISRMQNMREFDVGNNLHLSGNIPFEWFSNQTLAVFNIANNTFTGGISEAFCQLRNLQVLDLSNNLLSGVFPGCLWNLLYLSYMDLSSNAFAGQVPTSTNLISSRALSSLVYVHLSNNNFTGYFPPAINNLQNLMSLDLGDNKFSGKIPSWIGVGLPLLRMLRLRSNMFHGSLPLEVSQLSHLQLLDLAENNLTGSIPMSFGNFPYMEEMPEMYISTNISIGSFYDETYGFDGMVYSQNGQMDIIWKGRDYTFSTSIMLLTGIDLSSNSLSGEIPAELLNLRVLRFLNLSRNNLSGGIPNNIGNLKDMESLDLSWNKLTGPIPSSISQLMFLSTLNVSNNLLFGEIPRGNQLQTLNDPSIYSNNLGLCGPPLSMPCKNDSSCTRVLDGANEQHHELETMWLYYSVIAGMVFGFWLWFGALFFWKIWRISFFGCIDAMQHNVLQRMKLV